MTNEVCGGARGAMALCAESGTQILPRRIKIRNLVIDPPILLAPMAGLTHSALRRIIAGFGGAGLLSTEMLSARSVPVENPAVSPYLVRTASFRPGTRLSVSKSRAPTG